MRLRHPERDSPWPKKAGRANIKILFIGIVPPLLLMALATALDSLFSKIDRNPLIHSLFVLGTWACAIAAAGILLWRLYLPWLLRERKRTWNRVQKSLALVLIVIVYLSGYPEVALALAVIGIVITIKEGGEASRFGRRRRGRDDEVDETSWYYVGEGRGESPIEVGREENDPWLVLGLSRDAGPDEIRAAYRRVIKECHPDLNGGVGDSARFRLASEAYERLIE